MKWMFVLRSVFGRPRGRNIFSRYRFSEDLGKDVACGARAAEVRVGPERIVRIRLCALSLSLLLHIGFPRGCSPCED